MMIRDGAVTDETQSLLLALLQQIYNRDTTITNMTILNQHNDYVALRVNIEHPSLELGVKLAGHDAPYAYPFDRTANWHRLVAERTSIPMPEIVAVDVSYQHYPWRYLIKSYLPGETWAKVRPQLQSADLRQAYEQIGQAVGELHAITFEHFAFKRIDFYPMLVERVKASIQNKTLQKIFSIYLRQTSSFLQM